MERRGRAALTLALAATLAGCGEPEPLTPPRQLSTSPFHYPEELWDAGVEGETVLELFVSAAGSVDSAKVATTSGYPAFDSAAIAGVQDLEFEPAFQGEEAIAAQVLLPVQFHLPDEDSLLNEAPAP